MACDAPRTAPDEVDVLPAEIAFVREVRPAEYRIHLMRADGSGVRQVRPGATDGEANPAWSPDGRTIAFVRDGTDDVGNNSISTMRPDGSMLTRVVSIEFSNTVHPTWAPGASRIAFMSDHDMFLRGSTGYRPTRIHTVNLNGSELTATNPVTDTLMHPDLYPAWSPQGNVIAFTSTRAWPACCVAGSNYDLYAMQASGAGVVRLSNTPENEIWPAWSPDGRRIAFARGGFPPAPADIWLLNVEDGTAVQVTRGPGHNTMPTWSPDGSTIAFASDRDGNWEIYVIRPDASGSKRLTDDGRTDWMPSWRPR